MLAECDKDIITCVNGLKPFRLKAHACSENLIAAAACAKRFSGIASKSGNRSSACIRVTSYYYSVTKINKSGWCSFEGSEIIVLIWIDDNRVSVNFHPSSLAATSVTTLIQG